MITPQELFALLSDETRLRCIILLQKEKELCVCEFCHVIKSIQPKISRHLALLRQSGLASDERRGQWNYYRLNEKLQPWMRKFLIALFDNLKNIEPYRSDFNKLKKFRKNRCCSRKIRISTE